MRGTGVRGTGVRSTGVRETDVRGTWVRDFGLRSIGVRGTRQICARARGNCVRCAVVKVTWMDCRVLW